MEAPRGEPRGNLPTDENLQLFHHLPTPVRPNNMYQSIIQIFQCSQTSDIIIHLGCGADENFTDRSY